MMERIRKMTLKELKELENLVATERENRIENELSGRCEDVVTSITALLECCGNLKRHCLGKIQIECEDCEVAMDLDILSDGILEDISKILKDYIKD